MGSRRGPRARDGPFAVSWCCATNPDAPGGSWGHWALYDLSATCHALPEAYFAAAGAGRHGRNDFGRSGYGGPCPPCGHGPHHYRFRVLALDVEALGLPPG